MGAGPPRRTRMGSEGLGSQLVLANGGFPWLLVGLIGRCSMLILMDHWGVLSARSRVGRFFLLLFLSFLSARELVSLLSWSFD